MNIPSDQYAVVKRAPRLNADSSFFRFQKLAYNAKDLRTEYLDVLNLFKNLE